MYITSVEISNFRSFQGYHSFDFKYQDTCNLNLIFGKSGVGKSTFVDAIYWCLYGKEILNFPTLPLYNYTSFDELDVDDELPVIVACKFENNGEIYEIKRELSFIKQSNNKPKFINLNQNLNLFIHTKDGNVEVRNEALFDKFPEFLFYFLFYDDENSDFFDGQYEISLKKIIGKFGMFDIVDATNSHIDSVLNYYIKEIRKIDPKREDYGRILNQQEKILKNIEETNKEMSDISFERDNVMKRIDDIDVVISNSSKEANNLTQRRMELSNELRYLKVKIKDNEVKKQKLLFKSFPSLVMFSKISDSNELDNLLNNPNFENSSFYKRYPQIKGLYDNLLSSDYIKNDHKNLKELKNQYHMKKEELDEINNFFEAMNHDNLRSLVSKRKDLESYIQTLDMKLERLKMTRNSLNKSLNYNDTHMKKFNESQFSHDIIHRRIVFCKDAQEFGQQLREELSKHMLSKIEDYCNHIFFHRFGMNNKFKRVILKDSLDIRLIKHSNQILSVNDLSSSEKKLLKLSLIFSIYRCLGLKFPIILMDPFSKIDIDKIKGLFNFIFEEIDNQIIFVLNDTQYNDYIKHKFLKNNAYSYQLIENSDNLEVISYGN